MRGVAAASKARWDKEHGVFIYDGAELPSGLAPFRAPVAAGATTAMLAATLFGLPDRHLGLTLEDVTDQVSALVIQAGERRALEMLAGGAPLPDILSVIVRAIEQASADTIASILLLDDTGSIVQHGAAPGLPDAFNAAVHGQPIGPLNFDCLRARFLGEYRIPADTAPGERLFSARLVAPNGQNGYNAAGSAIGTLGAPRTVRASVQVDLL